MGGDHEAPQQAGREVLLKRFSPQRILCQKCLWEFVSKVSSLMGAFYPPFLCSFFFFSLLAQQINEQEVVPSLISTIIITFCSGQLLQTAPLKKPACLASAYLYNQKQRNPPGEIVRISLDSRTGQKQTEDAGSKEMCQEKRQNPSAENEKILERNSSLVSHHCVYSVKRLYKCSDCTKSFKWKSHLTCHQRIHSEERPFKSPDCPKSFKTNSHLMGHQRIHKGERPIKY